MVLGPGERAARVSRAAPLVRRLAGAGVTIVALSWVDNAGIARVKAVPVGRLERAAGWGVGMSPVFDVFLVNDDITTSKYIGGPGGDLRLLPDLERVTVLAAPAGLGLGPGGPVHPGRAGVRRAASARSPGRMAGRPVSGAWNCR